ncbi:MAG: hypothetical protein L6R42_004998, partial [Xanthoria sp. 1 TBL-2021]
MEKNILDSLPNDPLLRRIIARCTPSNPESAAILSQPHPLENLDSRLLEALAPKKHDLELNAFDLKLAAQYEETHNTAQDKYKTSSSSYFQAYNILLHTNPSNTTALETQLSKLHFIMQPMQSFKTPSKNPSLYELYLAYKTCLFRA